MLDREWDSAVSRLILVGRITLRGPLAYQPWCFWTDLKKAVDEIERLTVAGLNKPVSAGEAAIIRVAGNWAQRSRAAMNVRQGHELTGRLLLALSDHIGLSRWNAPLTSDDHAGACDAACPLPARPGT